MAYNEQFIVFGRVADFNTALTAGNLKETSIVFIEDTHQIWTLGTLYSCPYTAEELDLKLKDITDNYATKVEVNLIIEDLVAAAPEALDTLKELADSLNNDADFAGTMTTSLSKKVDKEAGKGLSTNDYTNQDKSDVGEMKGVLYNQFAVVTCTSPTSVVEKGVSTNVTVNWNFTFDGKTATPDTMKMAKGGVDTVTDKTVKTWTGPITDTTTFTVTASKLYGATSTDTVTKTASKTISAYYPKFMGSSSKTTLTSADILAFTKQTITSSAAGTYNVNVVNDEEYVWWCVPSTMTINKITLGGFAVPFQTAVTVAVDGKGSYKCYRSTNPLSAGSRSFVIS